jgi:hypothetical protein
MERESLMLLRTCLKLEDLEQIFRNEMWRLSIRKFQKKTFRKEVEWILKGKANLQYVELTTKRCVIWVAFKKQVEAGKEWTRESWCIHSVIYSYDPNDKKEELNRKKIKIIAESFWDKCEELKNVIKAWFYLALMNKERICLAQFFQPNFEYEPNCYQIMAEKGT